jgi:hypothetical protein
VSAKDSHPKFSQFKNALPEPIQITASQPELIDLTVN